MCGPDDVHAFSATEVKSLRRDLLKWYDTNKRDLPWRRMASLEDQNRRAYAVWVSEIMLQQTQVATVINYYERWMDKWPTLQALAKTSLEEVNEMWSGLGYYSRARRLHDGAKKVVGELGGHMPQTAATLERDLPGVGRYTAGAIASIALGQATGVVDGNVVRVFARLRAIGADSAGQAAVDAFWSLANSAVDPKRAGDFNQALMELGATVCTPKAPRCAHCPVSHLCTAYAQVQRYKRHNESRLCERNRKSGMMVGDVVDIECAADACKLCLPSCEMWDRSAGVTNYPRKHKKKPPRDEQTAVLVLHRATLGGATEYLIVQRPSSGLLANLWEFPSVPLKSDPVNKEDAMDEFLQTTFGIKADDILERIEVGPVVHVFSHIHQTYSVSAARLAEPLGADLVCERPTRWLCEEALLQAALSTAMKKVFKSVEIKDQGATKNSKGSKRKRSGQGSGGDGKKQLGLAAFFSPKSTSMSSTSESMSILTATSKSTTSPSKSLMSKSTLTATSKSTNSTCKSFTSMSMLTATSKSTTSTSKSLTSKSMLTDTSKSTNSISKSLMSKSRSMSMATPKSTSKHSYTPKRRSSTVQS